ELEGLENAVGDHGRTEAGAQAKKEHAAALVAAESLHGRVVDQLYRVAKGFAKIEADPAGAEVAGIVGGAAVSHHARIADGDGLIIPPAHGFLDLADHFAGSQFEAGGNLDGFSPSRSGDLHVCAADVEHEDALRLGCRLVSFHGV